MNPLTDVTFSEQLLRNIAAIDEFKGAWSAFSNLAPERLSALRKIATIESVGSSTRIEGVKLTDDEIEHLLGGIDITSFRTRDEQEVAGYAELMETVFASYAEIPLTENHIKQLHRILLKYSDKDARHRGDYKTLPNNVEAFDASGKSLGIIFETATPFNTPRMMTELTDWTGGVLETGRHHPLLVIAVFVVRFLAVHPFQDGNGRLSRAMTALLLLRSGYAYVPYASLERIVENNKDDYYRALRKAQSTPDTDGTGLLVWIEFFIRCLVKQKDALAAKIEREKLITPLPPLSEEIILLIRERGRVTVREAVAATGANRNTVKSHLQSLATSRHLVQKGHGKGTWYERA